MKCLGIELLRRRRAKRGREKTGKEGKQKIEKYYRHDGALDDGLWQRTR